MKVFLILCIMFFMGYTKDLAYTKNHIHAFLPNNNDLTIDLGLELMNDTLDVLNIKEREFGNATNLDSLGDMKGLDLGLGYAFGDDYYLHVRYNQKQLEYSGATLINHELDVYLRHQLYQNSRSAFALDFGYVTNIADDTYINDLSTINESIKKIQNIKGLSPEDELKITSNVSPFFPTSVATLESTKTISGATTTNRAALYLQPYIAIKDTKDESFYLRAILSKKTKDALYDIYLGYKYTKIKYTLDSSLAYEDSLVQALIDSPITITENRNDGMLFAGVEMVQDYDWVFFELSYRYNYMLRNSELQETNSNHIVESNVIFPVTNKFALYLGGKIMTNQFNGEVPYLYTEYSQSSFDHMYGYANTGILLRY